VRIKKGCPKQPFLVEMAGVEPASERLDPRISTSVVVWLFSLGTPQTTMVIASPATRTRKPFFRMIRGATCGTPTLGRPVYLRLEIGVGGRGPLWARLILLPTKRREAERKRLCGWHLCFALILRGRRLSARNPGPASSVEACHPRCLDIIQQILPDCQMPRPVSILTLLGKTLILK
jgi:hypothetical protein